MLNPELIKPVVAMLCIAALTAIAIIKGIDGVLLATALTVLAGLGGFALGKTTRKRPPS